jgi:hypothetical protein
MCALVLRNRAPASTTTQSISVEESLKLMKHFKHRPQTGPNLYPADTTVG